MSASSVAARRQNSLSNSPNERPSKPLTLNGEKLKMAAHSPAQVTNNQIEVPVLYPAVRWMFYAMFNVFFHVEVEGTENMPPDGQPTILCANHSNSLTDAIAIVATVPVASRKMVRLTAKDTFWKLNDPFSLLIRNIGTVPIKRRKDYGGGKVDNTESLAAIIESVESGDCVCLFPEGISRFHPQMAPLRTGVAMIANEVLTRNKEKPDFSLAILTASITYLHREKFRSACVIRYHPPIILRGNAADILAAHSPTKAGAPSTEEENKQQSFDALQELTRAIEKQIRGDLLDAPNWATLRIAHTARKLYAPHAGTRITLSGHVRLTRTFSDLLAPYVAENGTVNKTPDTHIPSSPAKTSSQFRVQRVEVDGLNSNGGHSAGEADDSLGETKITESEDIPNLVTDIMAYQVLLDSLNIKDHRLSIPVKLAPAHLFGRICFRVWWSFVLATISLPGLILLSPLFIAIRWKEYQIRRKGSLEDNMDEIAQYKLLLAAGILPLILGFVALCTVPIMFVTVPGTLLFMWLTVRWLEDLTASTRSLISLLRIVKLDLFEGKLDELRIARSKLAERVSAVAVHQCGLPRDPETLVHDAATQNTKVGGYFSILRRRKKDWNEVLRLHDKSTFD